MASEVKLMRNIKQSETMPLINNPADGYQMVKHRKKSKKRSKLD